MPTKQTKLHSPQTGSVCVKNLLINFSLKKNTRIKRIRFVVSPELGLVIESPKHLTQKTAQKLIQSKQDWIIQTLNQAQTQKANISKIKKHQNSVLIFGQEKSVFIRVKQPKNYILETSQHILLGFMAETITPQQAQQQLLLWLKQKAQAYIPLRLAFLNNNQFAYKRICIKDQKTIWGSCSADHNLHFSWRLIMAPVFASDYILLHELCHIKHLNHSKRFWKEVAQLYPDYKRAEKWFDHYGFVLHMVPK